MGHHLDVSVKVLFIFAIGAAGVTSQETKKVSVVNNCTESVWPAIYPGKNVNGSIAELKKGQSLVLNVPSNWTGLVWGRTGCNFDENSNGSCQTGGCGSLLECTEQGSPPASMALFWLGDPDYYEVVLEKGFNLPVVITALKGKRKVNCSNAGCDADLRQSCPSQLALKPNGTVTACKGICDVLKTDPCCGGEERCQPSNYSKPFHSACPAAAIYPMDKSTSTLLSCTASGYVVSFCTSSKGTVCSEHKGKISCNGSSGLTTGSPGWWALITLLPFLLATHL